MSEQASRDSGAILGIIHGLSFREGGRIQRLFSWVDVRFSCQAAFCSPGYYNYLVPYCSYKTALTFFFITTHQHPSIMPNYVLSVVMCCAPWMFVLWTLILDFCPNGRRSFVIGLAAPRSLGTCERGMQGCASSRGALA
jgi:hypothetical protein